MIGAAQASAEQRWQMKWNFDHLESARAQPTSQRRVGSIDDIGIHIEHQAVASEALRVLDGHVDDVPLAQLTGQAVAQSSQARDRQSRARQAQGAVEVLRAVGERDWMHLRLAAKRPLQPADAFERGSVARDSDIDLVAIEQHVAAFQERGRSEVIVGRRRLLYIFQIPGLFLLPAVFFFLPTSGLGLAQWGIFVVGLATISQMSFFGNYLPRVYPIHLRGTGESFAANVGGRMIGTCAALVTTSLVAKMPGASVPVKLAYAAGVVGTVAYVISVVASFWLPEPSTEELPD